MNDFTDHLQLGTRRLERDLHALLDDADDLLQHAVQDAGEGYAQARRRLEQRVKAAREQLATAREATRAEAADRAEAVVGYVKTHPWQAAALALGAGAVIAALLRARRDD